MLVCVLGCGTMGSGISSLFCVSSEVLQVKIWGRSEDSLEASLTRIKKELRRYGKVNDLSTDRLNMLYDKVCLTTDLTEVQNCDFYIEAISEDLSAKLELITRVKDFIPPTAIFATNTSSLSVTALGMQTNVPANFIGVHFFNPTSVMRLAEVIKGIVTSEDTLSRAIELVRMVSKEPVVVQESPGFIVNRMLIPMINEAVAILAEGVASKDDIDNAMKYGANHPIGPLALADLIGNDVCLSIMETLYTETGDSKYRAHPLLRQYVRAGYLGRKTKVGFYEY